MIDQRLRLRAAVDRRFALVAVVLVVLAATGGWATYATHVAPGEESQEVVASSWGTSAAFDHRAAVVGDPIAFAGTDTLRNRSTYFTSVTPVLDGTVRVGYEAAAAADVTVAVDLSFVLRSESGEGTVYWEEITDLGGTTAEGVPPGEPVEAAFSVNVSAQRERLDAIREELGSGPGEPAAFVRAAVRIEGDIDGERTAYTYVADLPIEIGGGTYGVADGSRTERIERTETVTVPREYGPIRTYGGPALLLGSLAGLVALGIARRRDAIRLSDAERRLLRFQRHREEFDDWITRIRLPESTFDRPVAEAATLADLVDFAIDAGAGVFEDPGDGRFHVVREEYLYTYTPPTDAPDEPRAAVAAPDPATDDGPAVEDGEGDGDGESEGDDGEAGSGSESESGSGAGAGDA